MLHCSAFQGSHTGLSMHRKLMACLSGGLQRTGQLLHQKCHLGQPSAQKHFLLIKTPRFDDHWSVLGVLKRTILFSKGLKLAIVTGPDKVSRQRVQLCGAACMAVEHEGSPALSQGPPCTAAMSLTASVLKTPSVLF